MDSETVCSYCSELKPKTAFGARSSGSNQLRAYCRPCESSYQKEYRSKNRDRLREYRQGRSPEYRKRVDNWHYYRITPEEYQTILDHQGGVCAICKMPESSFKNLAVDHDHSCCPGRTSCGECVRGLLCSRCNPGLGYFLDSTELLQAGIEYLRSFE